MCAERAPASGAGSAAVRLRDGGEDRRVLAVDGPLDIPSLARLWSPAMALATQEKGRIEAIDAGGVTRCDAAGATFLIELCERSGIGDDDIRGLDRGVQQLIDMLEPAAGTAAVPLEPSRLARLGRASLELGDELKELVAFIGELCVMLARTLRHPRQLRFADAVVVAERAGIGAIPIVTLIGFLLGLILAFQSAIPMQRFGAEIFVADLLGISLPRELGPLMAAILLTARSGSAFAAEIGTMRVNEELDALSTMGVDPVRFLIVPRVLAALVVVPALTMLVIVSGFVGGALVFRSLDFALVTFVGRIVDIAQPADLVGGLVKAMAFGVIVAAIGCLRGLQTGTDAGAVGRSTTRAVVSGIVLIACTDGIFAVVFFVLGI